MTSGQVEVHKIMTLKAICYKKWTASLSNKAKAQYKGVFFSIIVKMNLFPPQIKIINKELTSLNSRLFQNIIWGRYQI